GTGGAAGMGGAGGGMCTMFCADAVTNGTPICANDPDSQMLFDTLNDCTCVRTSTSTPPGCKDVCDANLCTNGTPDTPCQDCILNGNTGCATQYAACSNDAP
ncbi:MAG TPA: hypothetical protein PK156_43360, partial [Polyangium sp.]|nr:hypothetical protein [Polyangium sp.]